ncbi:MAG: SDR family NAD(P)-dependent oxidoreductase [Pseudomonadota bacterium]
MVDLSLDGRAVIVTGPAKGMGPGITAALAEHGADLLLVGRDVDALEKVQTDLGAAGGQIEIHPTDLSSASSVDIMAARAIDLFAERLYGLVNIAGLPGPTGRKIWEHSAGDYDELFAVNVRGAFLLMRAVLPHFVEQGHGSVVHIGGTFGHRGVNDASIYGCTKWALRGMAKSAALEAGPYGVRVNVVAPGGVDGPRVQRQLAERAEMDGTTADELYTKFAAATALRRLSKDSDIAAAVIFLMSDAARNITGQDLLVDGGTVVW